MVWASECSSSVDAASSTRRQSTAWIRPKLNADREQLCNGCTLLAWHRNNCMEKRTGRSIDVRGMARFAHRIRFNFTIKLFFAIVGQKVYRVCIAAAPRRKSNRNRFCMQMKQSHFERDLVLKWFHCTPECSRLLTLFDLCKPIVARRCYVIFSCNCMPVPCT